MDRDAVQQWIGDSFKMLPILLILLFTCFITARVYELLRKHTYGKVNRIDIINCNWQIKAVNNRGIPLTLCTKPSISQIWRKTKSNGECTHNNNPCKHQIIYEQEYRPSEKIRFFDHLVTFLVSIVSIVLAIIYI
ncbi:MAG: hypothetical protein LBC73_08015 [Oscillospiraceae bacterium]|jgi:hypothetical protein|nr:hypothetical protein [Oscillospiraceae bacterium]